MRTTVNIDDPILKQVKKLQKQRKTSLGHVVSELLALGLHDLRAQRQRPAPQRWLCRDMHARVNLEDKEAVYAAMDRARGSAAKDGQS